MKYNFKNVIAIGAHPDDIEIGCGGSLSKWKSEGVDVTCIIMSCENEIRLNETYKAMDVLGIPKQSIVIADFKDGCIPHNKEAVSFEDVKIPDNKLISALSIFGSFLVKNWSWVLLDFVVVVKISNMQQHL